MTRLFSYIDMALNKPLLKTQLSNLFTSLSTNQDGDDARDKLIDGLATIIDSYVRSVTVTTTTVTVGSATTQTGTAVGVIS